MDLRLIPDPARPEGGHALLQFRDGPAGPALELAIRDLRRDRWLAGGGWRSEQAAAGVFEVAEAGGGFRQIALGPGIVDRVEMDSYLEFRLGTQSARAVWPDSILPSPRAGGPGAVGVGQTAGPDPGAAGPLTGLVAAEDRKPEPEPAGEPPSEPAREESHVADGTTERPRKRGRMWLFVLLFVAAAILAVAAWILMQAPEEEPQPALDCGEEGFRGRWSASFEEQYESLVTCLGAGEVSPSLALRVLDSGIAAEHPDALLIYARLYDSGASPEVDVPVEFEPNPSRAVEYYARAKAAGNADAAAGLERTCGALRPDEDLLQESVFASYCQ